jgi:hypothetical protein
MMIMEFHLAIESLLQDLLYEEGVQYTKTATQAESSPYLSSHPWKTVTTTPAATPDYRGVKLKLRRAQTYANILKREVLRLKFPTDKSSSDKDGWMIVHYTGKYPPPRLALIVGDVAHNARSALDHLVWQLAVANSGKPGRHNVFPIYTVESAWMADVERRDPSRGLSPLDGLSSAARQAIRDCQPFATTTTTVEAAKTALFQLHRISLIDKHRTLHATNMCMTEEKPKLTYTGPEARFEGIWLVGSDFELSSGQEISSGVCWSGRAASTY